MSRVCAILLTLTRVINLAGTRVFFCHAAAKKKQRVNSSEKIYSHARIFFLRLFFLTKKFFMLQNFFIREKKRMPPPKNDLLVTFSAPPPRFLLGDPVRPKKFDHSNFAIFCESAKSDHPPHPPEGDVPSPSGA